MSATAKDSLAGYRQAAFHAKPATGPRVEREPDAPITTKRQPASRPAGGFQAEERGGRRKVVYLQPDVIEFLEAMQRAAEAEGGRLTQSGILNQLVRRYKAGG